MAQNELLVIYFLLRLLWIRYSITYWFGY
jgi:hypothetical protein